VIQDERILEKIKIFSPGMPKTAHCAIAICVDLGEAEARGGALIRNNAPVDVAFAAQNILLKAHELGLGTCVVKSYNEKSVGQICLLYTSPSPRDRQKSRMPSSA
jgi:nitroreductase